MWCEITRCHKLNLRLPFPYSVQCEICVGVSLENNLSKQLTDCLLTMNLLIE